MWRKPDYQEGITFLEVVLSLLIVIALIILAARFYVNTHQLHRMNQLRTQVGSLVAAVHQWKRKYNNYIVLQSNGIQKLLKDGELSRGKDIDAGILYNPWGYPIQLNAGHTYYQISTVLPELTICEALLDSYPQARCSSDAQFTLKEGVYS